jgi:hypothetical protein
LRATRAYITSFGTTGLLIASALLTLAVMSAFVAFNGFPGQNVQDPIGTLLLQEPQAQVSVPVKPLHVGVPGASKRSGSAARHRREAARNSQAPKASTGPVVHRTTPIQAPTRTQTPASAPSQDTVPLAQATPPVVPGTAPTLPDTGVPQVPGLTLPALPPPPPPSGSSQLPIDTSGITGLLGGG